MKPAPLFRPSKLMAALAACLRRPIRWRALLRTVRHWLHGSPPTAPPRSGDVDAARISKVLRQLLNRHPRTRQLMRHLAYVERALARQGDGALTEVPVEVLATALRQLDALVSNWSDPDLVELRSRLAVAVKQRSSDAFFGPDAGRRSDFVTASRLLVGDVGHSVFEELQRQYQGLLPPERIEAVLACEAATTALKPARPA